MDSIIEQKIIRSRLITRISMHKDYILKHPNLQRKSDRVPVACKLFKSTAIARKL